jgi:hypothetical protein
MSWTAPSDQEVEAILADTKRVTIVGASGNPARPSHGVAAYLLSSSGYDVSFVNPRLDTLLGEPVYPSLAALPEQPDLVSVFRRYDELPAVAEDVIVAGARTLWLQLDLWHETVAAQAESAGLRVVMDRCVKIDHARFFAPAH